jgi:hypothetical protein
MGNKYFAKVIDIANNSTKFFMPVPCVIECFLVEKSDHGTGN